MDENETKNEPGGNFQADAAAMSAAFSSMSGSAEARDYLTQQRIVAEKQARLLELQIADLERENRLRHWQLRFGSLSAVMKAAFEIALAFIFLAAAFGIGAAIWTAAHDDSLVIEAFNVPPDMAARGLTGQGVAAQLEDGLAAMQDATDSARPANSYAHNWGDDIKVQIPDTGVSVGQLYRLLTAWLGHQTRITGEVYRTAAGIVIAAHVSGGGSAIATGSEKNFDAVVTRAAEGIFARTQPYRYAVYEEGRGRLAEAHAILKKLSVEGATATERAWAFLGLGVEDGEVHQDIDDTWRSLAIVPDQAMAWQNLSNDELALDHVQSALTLVHKTAALLTGRHAPLTARAAAITIPAERATAAEAVGDFTTAIAENRVAAGLPDYSHTADSAQAAVAVDLAREHDPGAERVFARLTPGPFFSELEEAQLAFARHDWRQTIRMETAAEAAFLRLVATGFDPYGRVLFGLAMKRQMTAEKARAWAGLGDFARAGALIATTPADCYTCLRVRGQIDAAETQWNAADFWFAKAVAAAPDIPFAYSDWGEMLLAKGDLDAAIDKFRRANAKSPHFADPLEQWGEALIAKNRSDLALAKFAEADKYAPNWGRLHLKWGEALLYIGERGEAQKQFDIASHLDLSPADAAALQRVRATHA